MRQRSLLFSLLLQGLTLVAAPSFSASVAVPSGIPGAGTIGASGSLDQVYSVSLGSDCTPVPSASCQAYAAAEADFGVLRNYVYSNIGLSIEGYESQSAAAFNDELEVIAVAAGFFRVDFVIEGTYSYVPTPATDFNVQSFSSNWGLTSLTAGGNSQCFHAGNRAAMPVFPINCSLIVPVILGVNQLALGGQVSFANIGRANAVTMDFFNTARVTGVLVVDADGNPIDATISAASSTVYPSGLASSVPEPSSFILAGAGILALAVVVARSRSHASARCV